MRPRFFYPALFITFAVLSASGQTPIAATALPRHVFPGAPGATGAGPANLQPIVEPAPTDDAPISSLTLSEAPIDSVLQLLESFSGRAVLRPQALPMATYTININHPLPKSEAVRALETLLFLNGVGVVPLGDKFLKVVPLPVASREAPELISGSTLELPPSGHVAAKLFQIHFLQVTDVIPQIQQIMSSQTAMPPVLFQSANSALIVDTVSNLQRIEMLLNQVDQPLAAHLAPKFYTLQYAKASDLVNKLHTILQGPLQTELGTATSYTADDRTNQLILITDPRQYDFFDSLISKLDIKSDPNTRNEVIYLKHAVAKDVSSLLTTLISGQNSASQKSGGGNAGTGARAPAPPTPSPVPGLSGTGAAEFSSFITVVADDRSNAIVVSGTLDDITLIKHVVDQVDILLAQVSIEVLIAEVDLTDTESSGISTLNLTEKGTKITNFDNAAIAGWTVTSGVVNPLAFSAAMQNLGSKSNVHILSANTITTTHNKEADFQDTTQQPIITGTTAVPTGTTTTTANTGLETSSNVTYQNIGIEVKVTPLIGNDGSIQLTVDQKVDDIVGNTTIDGNSQPIIGHREATSVVNIQDGEMVVLGGLQQNKKTLGRSKLGFFYEIPILSNLFGAHNNEVDRTELLFFVRPHVINFAESSKYTNKRIDEMSNKKEVHDYLQDPTKMGQEPSLMDRFYH